MSDPIQRLRKLDKPKSLSDWERVGEVADEAADALEAQQKEIERLRKDAALGVIAMRYVDRAGDACTEDHAERICKEFHAAMAAEVDRQWRERMEADAAMVKP